MDNLELWVSRTRLQYLTDATRQHACLVNTRMFFKFNTKLPTCEFYIRMCGKCLDGLWTSTVHALLRKDQFPNRPCARVCQVVSGRYCRCWTEGKAFSGKNVCILNMEALVVLVKRTKTIHVQHTHLSLATPPTRIFSSLLDLARSMYWAMRLKAWCARKATWYETMSAKIRSELNCFINDCRCEAGEILWLHGPREGQHTWSMCTLHYLIAWIHMSQKYTFMVCAATIRHHYTHYSTSDSDAQKHTLAVHIHDWGGGKHIVFMWINNIPT